VGCDSPSGLAAKNENLPLVCMFEQAEIRTMFAAMSSASQIVAICD
jgi:hypothetical protein